jgi:hypothetical protein
MYYLKGATLNYLIITLLILTGCSSFNGEKGSKLVKSKIMVVGFAHLSGYSDKSLIQIDKLKELLKSWKPTKIAIESRPSEDIHKADYRSSFDIGYKKLLSYADGKEVVISKDVSKANKISYVSALENIRSNLNKSNLSLKEKGLLIKSFLVAYDLPNALLYWSQLTSVERKKIKGLGNRARARLNVWYNSNNETNSVAIPIARSLGHNQVYAVDYQEDGIKMVMLSKDKVERVYADSRSKRFMKLPFIKEEKKLVEEIKLSGDILRLIKYVNMNAANFDKQWDWMFEAPDPDGVLKLRYANWERRNLKIVSRLQDIASSDKPERVMFIVGAAHRNIVEKYLSMSKSIELIPFESLY